MGQGEREPTFTIPYPFQARFFLLNYQGGYMKNLFLTIFIILLTTAAFTQKQYRPAPVMTKAQELNERYTSGMFSVPDATYFDFMDETLATTANGYINILDWLQGRVAGLQVYHYRNMRIPVIRNARAAVFIDEMRIDPSDLVLLPVHDIAMIKVIKTPFLGSWGAPGGAIAIYTKDGGDEEGTDSEDDNE